MKTITMPTNEQFKQQQQSSSPLTTSIYHGHRDAVRIFPSILTKISKRCKKPVLFNHACIGGVSEIFGTLKNTNDYDSFLSPIYKFINNEQFRNAFSRSNDRRRRGHDISSPLKHVEIIHLYDTSKKNHLIDRFIKEGMETTATTSTAKDTSVILAFHGTPSKNIQSIINNGLDPKLRKGQTYGIGEYFTMDAKIAESYCLSKRGIVEESESDEIKGTMTLLVFALIVTPTNYICKQRRYKNNNKLDSYIVQDKLERQLPIAKVVYYRANEALPLSMRCQSLTNDLHLILKATTDSIAEENSMATTGISFDTLCPFFIKSVDNFCLFNSTTTPVSVCSSLSRSQSMESDILRNRTNSSYNSCVSHCNVKSSDKHQKVRIWFALVQATKGDDESIMKNGFPNDTIVSFNNKTFYLEKEGKTVTWVVMVVLGQRGVDFVPVHNCIDSTVTHDSNFSMMKDKMKIKKGHQILPLAAFYTVKDACMFRKQFIQEELSFGTLKSCFGSTVTIYK